MKNYQEGDKVRLLPCNVVGTILFHDTGACSAITHVLLVRFDREEGTTEAWFSQQEVLPEDYEPCGDCGFDHEYEPAQAHQWHTDNPCSYCAFDDQVHEPSCLTLRRCA